MVNEHLRDAQQGNTNTTSRRFLRAFPVVEQGVRLGKGMVGTWSVFLIVAPAAVDTSTHPVATAKITAPVRMLRRGEVFWSSDRPMWAPDASAARRSMVVTVTSL